MRALRQNARATLKGTKLIQVAPTGSHAQMDIPGVGKKWVHQGGVHDDSEVYWSTSNGKHTVEKGPGKLVLHGWYAECIGIELD